ncbi:hypothetical protein BJ508DRAFT_346308 [Ascobolus immersus RN42]|uniref:Uncharacterized protein n=1 Tax=Ascobolus immersus RN42 TaxID=1160509 RepID=A0A3N4I6N6_ASCIM|nr:hypothetical protein BJ508DRAFT_346308 [Ascobolus immersus RN42]
MDMYEVNAPIHENAPTKRPKSSIPPEEFLTKDDQSYALIRLRPSTSHFFLNYEVGPRGSTTPNTLIANYYPHANSGKLKEKRHITIDPDIYDISRMFIYQSYFGPARSFIRGVAVLKRNPERSVFVLHLHPLFRGEYLYSGKWRDGPEFRWPEAGVKVVGNDTRVDQQAEDEITASGAPGRSRDGNGSGRKDKKKKRETEPDDESDVSEPVRRSRRNRKRKDSPGAVGRFFNHFRTR